MNICLIIINYNGMNYLPLYLENVKNYCNLNNVDLYITDDNSKDGSVSYLIENNYIYSVNKNINKGFAANVNNGINFAIGGKWRSSCG